MTPGRVPLLDVLDESAAVVGRVAAPWMGLLWATSLPLRLLQAHFVAQLLRLGPGAAHHGRYLAQIATLATAALLPWLWGRAVFVRACVLALRGPEPPGAAALRVPLPGLASYVACALALELLSTLLAFTGLAIPLVALVGTIAPAVLLGRERPGFLGPLRDLVRHVADAGPLLRLGFTLAVALGIAIVNLHYLFRIGLWMAGGVSGLQTAAWSALLSLADVRYRLALLAGAVLLVEPWSLAAGTLYVHALRARETGEDLRLWLARLTREDAA